jgi:hypothetical protein
MRLGISSVVIVVAIIGCSPAPTASPESASVTPVPTPSPITYQGQFSPTGSMTIARAGDTATLLGDGQVLIAGGGDQAGGTITTFAAAELYDPGSGRFTSSASMLEGREGATATLLANGQVLIAGGERNAPLASAELYDPTSGTFRATGSLATPREGHTATLLPDGRVLIVGGLNIHQLTGSSLASAELFDPRTGTFSATASMTVGRAFPTATLLPDGRVLIAGGEDAVTGRDTPLATAEVYNPSSGLFESTGSMIKARSNADATRLVDGTVLITGGHDQTSTIAVAEVYDPSTGTFSQPSSMTTARYGHAAVLLVDGQVLVLGGYQIEYGSNPNATGASLESAEVYDPTTHEFSRTGSMAVARVGPDATLLLDGRVLVSGGDDFSVNGTTPIAAAEIYR